MSDLKHHDIWFATGSQDLYGEATLAQVDRDSKAMAGKWNEWLKKRRNLSD